LQDVYARTQAEGALRFYRLRAIMRKYRAGLQRFSENANSIFAATIAGAGNYFPIEGSAAAVVVTRTATAPAAVAAPAAAAFAAASPADSRRCLCHRCQAGRCRRQAGLCPRFVYTRAPECSRGQWPGRAW
jgi:hypothetical protein